MDIDPLPLRGSDAAGLFGIRTRGSGRAWYTIKPRSRRIHDTSRYIDTFSANGQGGGNLFVSSPTSGGAGTVCCVTYVQGRPAVAVTVRRESGGCMFRVAGGLADGSTHLAHDFFREIKVEVEPRIPSRPQNFEVHFYPDGHAEAAITGEYSSRRLVFSKSREDRSDFPRCPNEKEPTK